MHIAIIRYVGAAGKIEEFLPAVRQQFVPLLKACKGFLGYATMPSEQGDIVGFLIWESAEAVLSSSAEIRGWVQTNLKGLDEPAERFFGTVAMHSVVAPQSSGSGQPLYCLIRKSEEIPTDGSMRQNVEEMLAAAEKLPGFRGMYFARSYDDPTRGAAVLFCDTKEEAMAVHETTLAISRRNLPNVRPRVAASGQTAILATG